MYPNKDFDFNYYYLIQYLCFCIFYSERDAVAWHENGHVLRTCLPSNAAGYEEGFAVRRQA